MAGSGMKWRSMVPNTGINAWGPMLVLTKIGVTNRILPDAAAVELVSDAGPCPKPAIATLPTAAVPVVQGAPETVTFTRADDVRDPPLPTTLSGIEMFAGGMDLHGEKRQSLSRPTSGIGPLPPMMVPAPL